MYDLNDLWMVTIREKNGEVEHTEHLLFRAKSLEGCTIAIDRYLSTYFGDGEGDTVRDETKMLPGTCYRDWMQARSVRCTHIEAFDPGSGVDRLIEALGGIIE